MYTASAGKIFEQGGGGSPVGAYSGGRVFLNGSGMGNASYTVEAHNGGYLVREGPSGGGNTAFFIKDGYVYDGIGGGAHFMYSTEASPVALAAAAAQERFNPDIRVTPV
jgi:hypothetical protein